MQQESLKQFPTISQLIIVCGFGLLLGIISINIPPVIILMAVAGIIYLMIAWFWPEIAILVNLLVSSTIFNVYDFPKISFGVGHFIISDFLLFSLIGIIFLRTISQSRSFIVQTPLDVPLLAFYGISILSTVFAINRSTLTFNESLGEVRIVNSYLLFFVLTNFVRNEKQLRRLLTGIFFLTIFVAVAMIAQYILGDSVAILPGRVETLSTGASVSYGVTRVLPPGATLVVVFFVPIVVNIILDKTPHRFILNLIQMPFVGLAVLLTFVRTFWVVIVLALTLVGLLFSIKNKIEYARTAILIVFIVSFVVSPFLIIEDSVVANFVNGVTVRALTIFNPTTTAQENSLRDRQQENKIAVPVILAHPVLGLGLGAKYAGTDWYIHNGNYYLMLKTGIFGYLFFLWTFLLSVQRGIQKWRNISDIYFKGIILSFATMFIGFLVASLTTPIFMTWSMTPVIGIMFGISEVILRLHSNNPTNSPLLRN